MCPIPGSQSFYKQKWRGYPHLRARFSVPIIQSDFRMFPGALTFGFKESTNIKCQLQQLWARHWGALGKAGVTLRMTRWCTRGQREILTQDQSRDREAQVAFFRGSLETPDGTCGKRTRMVGASGGPGGGRQRDGGESPGVVGATLVRAPPEGLGHSLGRRVMPRRCPELPLASVGPFATIPVSWESR